MNARLSKQYRESGWGCAWHKITLIRNIYWALTMCTKCVLFNLVPTATSIFISPVREMEPRRQALAQGGPASVREPGSEGQSRFELTLTILHHLLRHDWYSPSVQWMDKIREHALTVKNTLSSRLQNPRSEILDQHKLCVCGRVCGV